ncbi:MAG: DUF2723 domain-containing protein [Candidatus Spechtbacterales bacterium]|nr:DUF2723 domain-containing protein [Candidatus Spechtbacterales bacterium]
MDTLENKNKKMNFFKKNLIPIILFLVVFGVYLYTAPPGATNYADSNELITASYILGVPHPPGYPLFVLLGKLFSLIPFGTVAYRYAIMAGFLGSLTVVLVYKVVLRVLTKGGGDKKEFNLVAFIKGEDPRLFALTGALSLAFSYLFWLYSYIPEAFAVSNFFAALIIYIGINWYFENKKQEVKGNGQAKEQNWLKRKMGDNYYPFVLSVVFVLGLLAHQIIIFFVPAMLYLIWITDRHLFRPSKRWFKIFAGILIGLLPVLYFPISTAMFNPVIDFGNVDSLKDASDLLSRRYYAKTSSTGRAYLPSNANLEERLNDFPWYFSQLSKYMNWAVVGLGIIGVLYSFYIFINGKRKDILHFIVLAYVFSGVILAMYAFVNHEKIHATYNSLAVHERMYLTGLVVFGMVVGLGAKYLFDLLKKNNLEFGYSALLILTLPVIVFNSNFDKANKHDFHLGEDYMHNLFLNMEPNAIFITHGDMPSFAAYYYKYAKGLRQDVTIVPLSMPHWQLPTIKEEDPELWDADTRVLALVVRDIIEENMGRRPIYFTGLPGEFIRLYGLAENPYVLSPRGLIQEATEKFEPIEDPALWEDMRWRHSKKAEDYEEGFAKEIIEQYVIGHFNSFAWYLRYGYNDLAKREYDLLMAKDPDHRIANNAKGLWQNSAQTTQRNVKNLSRTKENLEQETLELIENGDSNGAMGNLLYLAELDPKHVDYRLYLANLFGNRGWIHEAEQQVKKVLQIDPANDIANKLKRHIENLKAQNE